MKIFGQHEAGTLAQFEDVRSRAVDAALMADGHFGYVMPVGGVAAYRDRASGGGGGVDTACGNAADRTGQSLAAPRAGAAGPSAAVGPVGGGPASRDRVSVVGVGFDIACGNAAIRTDKSLADL